MNLRLERSLAIHDRLTEAAVKGRGMVGVAETVYELTGYPVVIEDSRGNLSASVGSRQPHPEEEEARTGWESSCNWPATTLRQSVSGTVSQPRRGSPGRHLRCSHWSIPPAQPARKNGSRWNTEPLCLPSSCPGCRASSRPSPASGADLLDELLKELTTSGPGCEPSSSDTT